jgi:hypothetical protein
MKYILLVLLIVSSTAKGQKDSSKSLLNSGITNFNSVASSYFKFADPPKYQITVDKEVPYLSDIDGYEHARITAYGPGGIMWQYKMQSDTLFVDTTQIKHIFIFKK